MIASYTSFDQDGDSPYNITISWYLNGTLYVSNSTNILSSITNKNDIWNFTITIFDGYNFSITYASPQLIIKNSPPTLTDVYINNNETTLPAGTSLFANFTFNDVDFDTNKSTIIYWWVRTEP